MGLFKKTKAEPQFTEASAPKNRKVTLIIEGKIYIPQEYGGHLVISRTNIDKQLLSTSDTDKEAIKEEIAQELEVLYNDLCKQIDNNSTELTNEFWYNLKLQKEDESEN